MLFPTESLLQMKGISTSYLNSITGYHWPWVCPGEANGNLLQYSCLENPMDRGAWWAIAHGVAKNQTQLSTAQHWVPLAINVKSGKNVQLLILSWGTCVNLSADFARCPPCTVPGHEEILFQPDLFAGPLSAEWYIPQSPFCGDALHTVWGPRKTATSWHLCDQWEIHTSFLSVPNGRKAGYSPSLFSWPCNSLQFSFSLLR